MKKFFKIAGGLLVVLLVLLLTLPFLFKGKIMKIAKQQINNNLNAKADFEKLSVSLFRSFPNVSVGIRNFYIAGLDEFEGDTLFSVKSFDLVVDIVSAIKMENIEIRKISMDEPRIHAWILPNGHVNWDIMKDSGDTEEDTTGEDVNPVIKLKDFRVIHAIIKYDDDTSNMSATLEDFNFAMTGDMAADFTTLSIHATTGLLNLVYDGVRYLKDAGLVADMDIDADLVKSSYTLKNNSVALNNLKLKFDGMVSMPNDEDMLIDLKFGLDKADFKSLLSLIPAIYMKDYADVKTSGMLKMEGTVKGTYNEKTMPNVQLSLLVSNAMFKYPGLPKSADHIGIDMNLFYDGVQADNSTIDVNKFHVELGGNPVDLSINIKTPVSDMHVNGNLKMDLDLATVNDVIPLDSTTLTGKIKADLDFMGYISSLEKGEYEQFKADGNALVENFTYKSPDLPAEMRITTASLLFSPQFLDLKKFDAVIGKSDLHLSGKLEDFIPYVFKDKTIHGNFIFTSAVLDLNEFLTESTEASADSDTLPLTVFEVPANVDFKLISRIDKMYYDKLEIANTIGTILVKESRVILDGVSMNMLSGSMQLSGEYNTSDIKTPTVDFTFKATSIDIPSAFDAFTTLQQYAPLAKKAVGKISLGMNYASNLDAEMMPVMNSVVGKGNITSDVIGIKNSATFDKIGNALNTKAFDNMTLTNVGIKFEIRNGRVILNPFETKAGSTTFLIGGDQGLDQTMNYTIGITIPRSELGPAANAPVDKLLSQASAVGLTIDPLANLNIKVKVTGTFTDPKVGLDLRQNAGNAKEEIKAQVIQAVQEQIDKTKEEARAAAQAEADKILAEARREADLLKQKAQDAANIVRQEANSNAESLVKKAKDPISKRLAEEGAKKIKQEGEASAQKIIKEADVKAEGIINAAREESSKLLAP